MELSWEFDDLKLIYNKLSVCSLRAWKKLREVLQSWIQTSGQDDQTEKNTVCQEIKEVRLFLLFVMNQKKSTVCVFATCQVMLGRWLTMFYVSPAVLTLKWAVFSLAFAFVAVDSWRSASTGCPLSWQNKNQRCCYIQRGSSIYRQRSRVTLCWWLPTNCFCNCFGLFGSQFISFGHNYNNKKKEEELASRLTYI